MAGEKILVVDDEKIVREAFCVAFEQEYCLLFADSGQQALNILNKPNDIDLVILDVVMPGLNGIQLVKQIKKTSPQLNVIMLTGYSSKDVAIEALRAHADEFIEKPFDIKRTREIIERLLKDSRFSKAGTKDTNAKINKAQEFIRRNYNKPLSMKETAGMVYFSPKYFSRLFKKKVGSSFSDFKVGLRIGIAKQQLRQSSYSINQIARIVGYQNPDSFMKMFKRVTGLTPSEYRNGKT